MNSLPTQAKLPDGLVQEKPASNLAALATTDSLGELQQVVLTQWSRKETFAKLAKHGIRPIDRLLFWGPPGNGKTMASQWLAKQLGVPLYRVRSEALVGMYLGETQSRLGAIMAWLERQPHCVTLWDEVEMLFPSRKRDSTGGGRELQSAMSVFWQYLDRWESPTLFVLATNMPDRLDDALLSRMELKMEFGPPTRDQIASVAHYWAEVLHEYGGSEWGPVLAGREFESFRALFHAVQASVRKFVTGAA